jgi:hypothetical protein
MEKRAVDIVLGGRYSLASRYDTSGNRREFACRTSLVSPFEMTVSVPVIGPVGERVISYFGEFGSVDGWITNSCEGSFVLDLKLPRQQREKFAEKLTWLNKHQKENVIDARQQKRIVPRKPHSTLIFANGSTVTCLVIDISPSGVAVSADVEPEIGTRLAVGRSVGFVVRKFPEGFAVQFDRVQEVGDLEMIICPPKDVFTYGAVQRESEPRPIVPAASQDDIFFVD